MSLIRQLEAHRQEKIDEEREERIRRAMLARPLSDRELAQHQVHAAIEKVERIMEVCSLCSLLGRARYPNSLPRREVPQEDCWSTRLYFEPS